MKNIILPVLLVSVVLLFVGCSGNKPLTGKISYPDGTPLSRGFIFLVDMTTMVQSRGEIQSDGTYRVGSVNEKDGLPPGNYSVYIVSEIRTDDGRELLVDEKYTSEATSGLKCQIPAPKNRFDFVVERPDVSDEKTSQERGA